MLEAGVKIYEYTPGFVHAKVFVSDDCKAVVGTINLDYRSFVHHFECGVWMYRCDCLKNIKEDAYVIALCIDGKQLDSEELSQKIEKLGIQGESHIYFVIGGSLGLADEVINRADYKLSFSKMTFPHQLMRVILLEQIYRAYRIMNHEPYHK